MASIPRPKQWDSIAGVKTRRSWRVACLIIVKDET